MTIDTLDALITDILQREGWPTYTDRAADRGGPTKGGITLTTLRAWRGGQATVAALQALTEEEARQIYRSEYVDRWGYDTIPDAALQTLLVDWTVMSGPSAPIRALQRALGVVDDGIIGPKTRAAIAAAADLTRLARNLAVGRTQAYVDLALNDADVKAFLAAHPASNLHNIRGWINRALSFV